MAGKTIMLFSHICNPEHITGAEKLLVFMLQELIPYHRTILVVPNEGIVAQQARSFGAEVIVQPFPLMWQLWEPGPRIAEEEQHWNQPVQLSALMNLMHMHRPDLIITNTCVNALPAMAAKRLGIPSLWMITEVIQEGPYTTHSAAVIHRYATWVAGISEATLEPFRRAGLINGTTMLLYPSWRPESLNPDTWNEHRRNTRAVYQVGDLDILIGFIAADIAPHKGFDHFVDMAIRLCPAHPNVQFMVVGNPFVREYYDVTMHAIHTSGHASRFKVLPFSRSVESVFPAMDIVVMPSLRSEGFGLTAMEGMAFGKPVVAYRSGGLEEILAKTGMSSLLVPQGDIPKLTEVVSSIVHDRNLCHSLGAACQQSVNAVYGIAAYRARLHQLLHSIESTIAAIDQQHAANRAAVPDGALLKGMHTPAVFYIQGGRKRPFASEGAFFGHGFGWHQVQTVDDALLQCFPNEQPIW